jgi:hypothetical protein
MQRVQICALKIICFEFNIDGRGGIELFKLKSHKPHFFFSKLLGIHMGLIRGVRSLISPRSVIL